MRHQDAVAALCRRWLRDEQLAEDATQETFLRAWSALPHYMSTGDFRSWLRRIARNHCHDVWRSQHGRAITEVPTDVYTVHLDQAHLGAESPERVADRLAVRGMLNRLSNRDAAMLVEHHAAGLPVHALARRWQLTRGATEVALHRARQRARRCAHDEGLLAALPVAMSRRFAAWWGQLAQQSGLTVANLGEAFCVAVAAAVLAAVPTTAPAQSPSQMPAREAQLVAVRAANGTAAAHGASVHSHSSAPLKLREESDDSRHKAGRRTRPGPDHAEAPGLDAVDGVALPRVDRTVSGSGSGRKTGRLGVQTPDGRNGAYMQVNRGDPQPLVDTYDTACENTSPDDPLVYCDSTRSR